MTYFLKKRNSSGYTLIEAVIYLAILVVIISVVIALLLAMMRGQERVRVIRDLQRSGTTVMERVSREIRGAQIISSVGANSVIFSTLDQSGVLVGREILVEENDLWLIVGGNDPISLLSDEVTVETGYFSRQVGEENDLVFIRLVLGHKKEPAKQELFFMAVNLR